MFAHISTAARATLNAWVDRVGLMIAFGLIVGGLVICLRAIRR